MSAYIYAVQRIHVYVYVHVNLLKTSIHKHKYMYVYVYAAYITSTAISNPNENGIKRANLKAKKMDLLYIKWSTNTQQNI